jgi:hypothetical protein
MDGASLTKWADSQLEQALLADISLDVPWAVIERFASLVRLSGSVEERAAIDLLRERLERWGVPHQLYEPMVFISLPLRASVRAYGKIYHAKTPAMAVSTGGQEISGELVYVPSTLGTSIGNFFASGVQLAGIDVRGKIVITEGMAFPSKVTDIMRAGALAGIFVNPGTYIHEGICTSIWGTPDLDSSSRQPGIPVAGVNNPDGQELIALAKADGSGALSTLLDTGWRTIPVLVAEIPGVTFPEEFVLLHGHLDSWHVGIGDNATGDATLLEMARVFWQYRDQLARSLRVAWWSGHSHGRYAGSTWYADTFAIDLARNCVAQVNCDSPGCRWADTYNDLTAMSETVPFVDAVIRDITAITPHAERPPRAGDYSFNNVGISSFYMLSSTMSRETQQEHQYYAVGGCGGNIEWHTEDDLLDIADKSTLLRDMRMYAASLLRTLNAPLHPFDWTQTAQEFRRTLERYQQATADDFDFSPSLATLARLEETLERFYTHVSRSTGSSESGLVAYNFVQRRLGRILIPVNYSRMAPFWHDPALDVPPLPDLAPALAMASAKDDVARRGTLQAHLRRGQNRLIWALEQAREVVEHALM